MPAMNFEKAVEQTEHLQGCWRPGLQALRDKDKPHVVAEDTRRLTGSVDIDTAYEPVDPNANRWDFAIAYQHTNRTAEVVYFIEPHTADDSEVETAIKKANWLRQWLRGKGYRLAKFERGDYFYWIASGATEFTRHSESKRKRMAAAGLKCVGRKQFSISNTKT